MVQHGRLRWFGHVERINKEDWLAACRDMLVEGEKVEADAVKHGGRYEKT